RHDVAARIRPRPDRIDDLRDLVDRAAFRRGPAAPLRAVHRPEIAVRVGPLVPDGDAALLQPADVGLASQEPEQLVDDRLEMDFLGGQQREAGCQVESHLPAEGGQRAGARAVGLPVTVLEHVAHEIEVLLHRGAFGCICEIITSYPRVLNALEAGSYVMSTS